MVGTVEAGVGEHLLCSKRQTVVGDEHAVDLTAGSGEELFEDHATFGVVPAGTASSPTVSRPLSAMASW